MKPELRTALADFARWAVSFFVLVAATVTSILVEGGPVRIVAIVLGTVAAVHVLVLSVVRFRTGKAVFGSTAFPVGLVVVFANSLYVDYVPGAVTKAIAAVGLVLVVAELFSNTRRRERVSS